MTTTTHPIGMKTEWKGMYCLAWGRCKWLIAGLSIVLFSACKKKTPSPPDDRAIISAKIITSGKKIPSLGDLWLSTWASDDNLYVSWGDGVGPGTCYPIMAETPDPDSALTISGCDPEPIIFCEDFCGVFSCDGVTPYAPCVLTQAGVFRLEGPVDQFSGCDREQCIRSIHIPSGIPQFKYGTDPTTRRGDKPSSLLFYNGTLYWHGHQLMASPHYGYIAYSTDYGKTWTEVPNSPWTEESNFRVLMLINMGKNYALNTDGFVYGLGIHGELIWPPANQQVYLARVPKDSIAHYNAYRYFTGLDADSVPQWSKEQTDAAPLPNLTTVGLGAAMYHPGVKKYLFLALPEQNGEAALTLFYADKPWGPWRVVQRFDGEVYIPGVITKDTGPKSFYFTAAGGGGVGNTYQLTIAKIEMELP